MQEKCIVDDFHSVLILYESENYVYCMWFYTVRWDFEKVTRQIEGLPSRSTVCNTTINNKCLLRNEIIRKFQDSIVSGDITKIGTSSDKLGHEVTWNMSLSFRYKVDPWTECHSCFSVVTHTFLKNILWTDSQLTIKSSLLIGSYQIEFQSQICEQIAVWLAAYCLTSLNLILLVKRRVKSPMF